MRRKKCQIFTPEAIVSELLDYAEYKSKLYGKKVLENSCGEGNILIEIIRRYIEEGLKNNLSLNKIKSGLEEDIYGIEYYKNTYEICLENLNKFVKKYGIFDVKWNLICGDSLKIEFDIKFDFIIGNPPYLTYGDLSEEERRYLKEKYESCIHGKFDYCYAFIEDSLEKLSFRGKLVYLIPNSIFKTVFGKKLREIMIKDLKKIVNYTTKKLFEALTSSAIIVCEKNSNKKVIEYIDVINNKKISINKNELQEKWIFEEKYINKGNKKFGDYFKVSNTIATLYNKAYILREDDELNRELEADGLKKAYSPRNIALDRNEFIIFPYYYKKNKLFKYTEENFYQKFPKIVKHLKKYSEELSKRKSDRNTKWYEYGRSQALAHMNCEKLLISTVITQKVHVYELGVDDIPYTGLYIITKGTYELKTAKEILESDEFMEYIDKIGVNASGVSKRITSRDVENFKF